VLDAVGTDPALLLILSNRFAAEREAINDLPCLGEVRVDVVVVSADEIRIAPTESHQPGRADSQVVHRAIEECDATRAPSDEIDELRSRRGVGRPIERSRGPFARQSRHGSS